MGNLARYVDYEVDPRAGRILLKRPLPATDPAGNPVFLSVTYETNAAADASPVWGVRARTELGDSGFAVPLGVQYVRDDMTQGGFQMAAGELGMNASGVRLGSEIAYARTGEQADYAARVTGRVSWFGGRVEADAEWRTVGEDFVSPADRSLHGGTQSLAAGASAKLGDGTVSIHHEHEDFGPDLGERTRNEAAIGWKLGRALHIKSALQTATASRDTLTEETQAIETRATVALTKHLKTWLEGRLQVTSEGSPLQGGNYAGGGASPELGNGIALEARHLIVRPDAGEEYSLTSLGVRSESSATGTRVWGNYQIQGGISEAQNAAVLGLNQQLRLGEVTLNAMFERREGVEHAPLLSPTRALPYGEPQDSYWAAGLGAEYLPKDRPYRLAARLEWKDGNRESSRLASLTGDVTIGGSLALLARQQWQHRSSTPVSGNAREMSLLHTVFGLAYRPSWSDGVNALLKVDWKPEEIPTSGLLATQDAESERLILAGEVVWSPVPALEIGTRYGHRFVQRHVTSSVTGDVLPITTDADFAGARAQLRVTDWAALRFETQALRELASGTITWSAAPSLVVPIGRSRSQAASALARSRIRTSPSPGRGLVRYGRHPPDGVGCSQPSRFLARTPRPLTT